MWALIHLGSSEIIYIHEYKFNVRDYLRRYYFYRDTVNNTFEVRSTPPSETGGFLAQKINGFWVREERKQLTLLNRCEFDIIEVDKCGD